MGCDIIIYHRVTFANIKIMYPVEIISDSANSSYWAIKILNSIKIHFDKKELTSLQIYINGHSFLIDI